MAAWIRRADARLIAVLILGVVSLPGVAAGVTPKADYAPLLDGSRDEIVRSKFVPSGAWRVGEVRLVRRGPAVVMQTVLDTSLLARVVAEIGKKDLANWPTSRRGHDDAMKYVEAIRSAQAGIQEPFRHRENRGDRRPKMLIEFILSRDASIVAIAEPSLAEADGHVRVVSRRPIAILPLSRAYVRGNIYEIAWDALKLGRRESRDLLEPMLPPESP